MAAHAKNTEVLSQSRARELHGGPCLRRIPPTPRARRCPAAHVELRRRKEGRYPSVPGLKWVRSITLVLGGSDRRVTLSVSGRGDTHPPEDRPPTESYELAAIRHRMAALAGGVSHSSDPCEVSLCAWLPVENELPF